MKEVIRKRARDLGFDECRFTSAEPPGSARYFQAWLAQNQHGEMGYLQRNAHKRVAPELVLTRARTLVTLAVNYADQSPTTDHQSPSRAFIARYARYRDYHDVLGEKLKVLTAFLSEAGGKEARSLWYVDTGPFLERDLAQRAGLGFIGKHTNLISRKFGNWLFLCEIITTIELEPDEPEINRCGTCSKCITACPTAAIRAPFQLDARRCISYLTIELKGSIPVELRPAIGNRIYGCDDCLAVCPWNRFAREGQLMLAQARPDLAQPDLLELLALDEPGFRHRFGGTPMLRTKRRGLLRNVCVALGNSGNASVLPALEKAAHDSEPLIAEHAAWAVERLRRQDLQDRPGSVASSV